MTPAEQTALAAGPFVEHVATEGQRWDQIAALYYGDATRFEILFAANPALPFVPILEAGWRVLVPVVPTAAVLTVDLPPWKQ